MEIGPLVPEKIFKGFYKYGPAGHPGHVIPTHRGSTQKLALIGQAVSEMVEHCRRTDGRKTDDRWTSDHGYTAALTYYYDPVILRNKLTPLSIFRDLSLRKGDSKKFLVYFYVFYRLYTNIQK